MDLCGNFYECPAVVWHSWLTPNVESTRFHTCATLLSLFHVTQTLFLPTLETWTEAKNVMIPKCRQGVMASNPGKWIVCVCACVSWLTAQPFKILYISLSMSWIVILVVFKITLYMLCSLSNAYVSKPSQVTLTNHDHCAQFVTT